MKKRKISPCDGMQYFFGYYDIQPYNIKEDMHLCNRVGFLNRLPDFDDLNEVGYINLDSGEFVKIAQSKAWNFQQGSMLRWYNDSSVIFNDFYNNGFVSRVCGLNGGERVLPMPIADYSPLLKRAVSVNFARIYDFRKGYGYVNAPDKFYNVNAPDNDGIFLLDTDSGKSELILSYAKMRELFNEPPYTDEKLVVNHINFSPSGSKLVFLLRNFGTGGKWRTLLGVTDLYGNAKKLTDFEVNSHYSFFDDDNLMIYSGLPEWGVYFINLNTGERQRLNNPVIDKDDVHCNYSPDKSRFIGDGYPDSNNMRSVYIYDFSQKKERELFKVYSMPVALTDIRCDLHCRWNHDGSKFSYDSTENGVREIFEITL